MSDDTPWATQYASFIFLGLSICVGYVIWRTRAIKRNPTSRRDIAEELLEKELADIDEQRRGGEPAEHDGSGLGGPAYSQEQQDVIRRAKGGSEESR